MQMGFKPAQTIIELHDHLADAFHVEIAPIAQIKTFVVDNDNRVLHPLMIDRQCRFARLLANKALLRHEVDARKRERRARFCEQIENALPKNFRKKKADLNLRLRRAAGNVPHVQPFGDAGRERVDPSPKGGNRRV